MGGNRNGGVLAGRTNRERYGEDFYRKIGAAGGRKSHGGGFSDGEAGKARARLAGAKGGALGRITPRRPTPKELPCTFCHTKGHIAFNCAKRIDKLNPNRRILEKYSSKGKAA